MGRHGVLDILKKYGLKGLMAGGAAASSQPKQQGDEK